MLYSSIAWDFFITDRTHRPLARYSISPDGETKVKEKRIGAYARIHDTRSKYPLHQRRTWGDDGKEVEAAGEGGGKKKDRARTEHAPCSIWLSHVVRLRFLPSQSCLAPRTGNVHSFLCNAGFSSSFFFSPIFPFFSFGRALCVRSAGMHGKNRVYGMPLPLFSLDNRPFRCTIVLYPVPLIWAVQRIFLTNYRGYIRT